MKQTKILQVGLKTFIINDKGELLMLFKGSRETYKNGGSRWDIPGGRIETGKNILTNLKREVFEETGIRFFKIICSVDVQDILRPDKHVVRVTYISRVTSGSQVKLSDEHTKYAWLNLTDVMKLKHLDLFVRDTLKDKHAMSLINKALNIR